MSYAFAKPFEVELLSVPTLTYVELLPKAVLASLHELLKRTKRIEYFMDNNALTESEFRKCKLQQKSLFVEFFRLFLDHAPGLSFKRMIRETTGQSDEVVLARIQQEFETPGISDEVFQDLMTALSKLEMVG